MRAGSFSLEHTIRKELFSELSWSRLPSIDVVNCSFDREGRFCAIYMAKREEIELWDFFAFPVRAGSLRIPQVFNKEFTTFEWAADGSKLLAVFGPAYRRKKSTADNELYSLVCWDIPSLTIDIHAVLPFGTVCVKSLSSQLFLLATSNAPGYFLLDLESLSIRRIALSSRNDGETQEECAKEISPTLSCGLNEHLPLQYW